MHISVPGKVGLHYDFSICFVSTYFVSTTSYFVSSSLMFERSQKQASLRYFNARLQAKASAYMFCYGTALV